MYYKKRKGWFGFRVHEQATAKDNATTENEFRGYVAL